MFPTFDFIQQIQYITDMLPDPLKDYVMKGNPPRVAIEPVALPTLTELEQMPRAALHSLLERICCARWGETALMDETASYEAVCLKLLHGGLTEESVWKALPALKEWMDRRKGKPAQTVAMTLENKGLDQLSTEKLMRLAAMLDEPVIIAPMPQKLDDVHG